MTWVKLDDAHQDHPKIAFLSDRAYRLWVRAIAYSNKFGLNGDLTAAQLRQIRGPIKAKVKHEAELVESGLWRQTDGGIEVHDIGDYQLKAVKSADISQKRSDAGKMGAAARWNTDGKLPLANDAPVPSRPVPSRPEEDHDHDPVILIREMSDLELRGTSRKWPAFANTKPTAIARCQALLPITEAEFEAAARTTDNGARNPSFSYFATCIERDRTAIDRAKTNTTEKPYRTDFPDWGSRPPTKEEMADG